MSTHYFWDNHFYMTLDICIINYIREDKLYVMDFNPCYENQTYDILVMLSLDHWHVGNPQLLSLWMVSPLRSVSASAACFWVSHPIHLCNNYNEFFVQFQSAKLLGLWGEVWYWLNLKAHSSAFGFMPFVVTEHQRIIKL